jgi:hypothetical protein
MAASSDPLQRIPHLYHFTDVTNLPMIKRFDGLLATTLLRETGEEFCAGGDEDSLLLDVGCGMDKYVHLCFKNRHPSAWRIKEKRPEANLIYLTIDPALLHQPGVMFTTGVGYANGVRTVTLAEACEDTPKACRVPKTWVAYPYTFKPVYRKAHDALKFKSPQALAFDRFFPSANLDVWANGPDSV